jgi:hypothetical protein
MRSDSGQPSGEGVNAYWDAPSTTVRGRWLLAARAGWVAVAALALGLLAVGFVIGLDRPDLTPQMSTRARFTVAGVPHQVTDVVFVIDMAAFAVTGLLIFWHRSNDWVAMLFALLLVTSSVIPVRTEWALERAVPWLELPVRCVWLLVIFLWLVLSFVFPDGRFVPRWTRLLAAAAIPAAALLVDLPKLFLELPDVSQGVFKPGLGLAALVFAVFLGPGLYAQAHRYRHVSGPVQRQQTKWVALTLGLLSLVVLFGIFIPSLFVTSHTWFFWAMLAMLAVLPLFPASVAVAILRHHLYDIDRLISRTLVYGLLTVVLGSLYAGAVVVLGQALNPQGGDSPLAVAASTLLVAALFQPLRRRIQTAVDRRFNRRRYDAAKTMEAFSARLREQVDLDTLSAELLAVVDQTMQPTMASLWLRPFAGKTAKPRQSPAFGSTALEPRTGWPSLSALEGRNGVRNDPGTGLGYNRGGWIDRSIPP